MERESKKRFPTNPKDYKLYEEVGEGVSATVHRALCVPLNVIVAIKVLDLDKCNSGLDAIRREAQTMSLIDHPNVLRAHCSFTADSSLWVVMPYMAGGSCLHVMKSAYPEGFEEPVIATLLWEVLKALVYLHGHGHIHRDVKAGNILMNANGAVKLADFGVSASVFDAGDRQRSRNTFVGTPCWMAPEVMQQLHGYDFKADIWSFGITALELAHGHAPFSKYPPMKVLLMTLQNAPPCLDYERDRKFSKSFKDMVATCLVKDPKKRPASEKLLKHPFFKHARSNEYLARTILDGLPPLGERFRSLKGKESDFLMKNKAIYGDKEELSQQRYIRGISGWNFNLDDLKAQAALLTASDDIPNLEDLYNHPRAKARQEDAVLLPMLSPERVEHENATSKEETVQDFQDLEGPFANAFRSRPLHALKGCFDVCEDDIDAISPKWKDPIQSNVESMSPLQHLSNQDLKIRKIYGQNLEKSYSVPRNINFYGQQKFSSGSCIPEHVLSSSSSSSTLTGERVERDEVQQQHQHGRKISGPLYPQMKGFYNRTCAHEESLEGKVVQCKGRFKVTSTDSCPKAAPANCMVNPVNWVPANATVNAGLVSPTLQFMLQQNTMQQEQLIKLMKILKQTSCTELSNVRNVELMPHSLASSREKELQAYLVHLQQRIGSISEELQQLNFENSKLEQQISALSVQKGKGRAPPKKNEA